MTDSLSALRLITETGMPDRERALASFYERWRDEPLVVNKWFALQAMIEDEAAVERVEGLMAHPAFAWGNPNRVRAVLGSFATMNLWASTAATGPVTGCWPTRCSSSTAGTRRSRLDAVGLGPLAPVRRGAPRPDAGAA